MRVNPHLTYIRYQRIFANLAYHARTRRTKQMKHNPKQIAIYIKAFRTISRQFDIIQTDLALLLFVSYRTLTRGYMSSQGFHNRLKHVMFRGYIVQCEGKGVRLKASDKGIDILNQYYSLVSKLSEVKPTKQATKRLIDSI